MQGVMKTLSLDEIVCCLVGMKFFFLIEPYSEAQIKILVVVSHLQNYKGIKSRIGCSFFRIRSIYIHRSLFLQFTGQHRILNLYLQRRTTQGMNVRSEFFFQKKKHSYIGICVLGIDRCLHQSPLSCFQATSMDSAMDVSSLDTPVERI